MVSALAWPVTFLSAPWLHVEVTHDSNLYTRHRCFFVMQSALAWVGTFLSLLLIGGMQQWMNMHWSIPLLLSAFGPSCALVFGLPTLLSSQLTNSIGIQTDMSKLSIFA